jgi:2Fe-2S ferredoxin
MHKNNISIKVLINNREYVLDTYDGEYPNLMMLISDKLYLEDFGECKGIGRCGTCHLFVIDPTEILLTREGNENTTLKKSWNVKDNSRLACQIIINESVNGICVHLAQ